MLAVSRLASIRRASDPFQTCTRNSLPARASRCNGRKMIARPPPRAVSAYLFSVTLASLLGIFELHRSLNLEQLGNLWGDEARPAPRRNQATDSAGSLLRRHDPADPIPSGRRILLSDASFPSTSSSESKIYIRNKKTVSANDFPPRPKSFYESRWHYKLPDWASKPFFFNKDHTKRVCFVHVGKAAGSSLGCSLGFQLHCNKEMKYPLGTLPTVTTNVIHNDVTDCDGNMDIYLYSLRDPLERIRSWYVYDKYKLGLLRYECNFWILNDLAEVGLKKKTSDLCNNRAKRAILGLEKFGKHGYYNYRFYRNQVPSNATIAVIRAEHMLDDWNSMERMLGSSYRVKQLPERNSNKQGYDEKYLTDDSKRLLCEQLCDEIQVYKDLLMRAANLNASDVEQSLAELRKSCPREADLPACPK